MPAGTPDISSVGEALEGLVHQFSDPWAFLRELIQNSMDAGSEQIDVRIEHDAALGMMVIEVADAGEGMTREIIDTKLTRLFSSTKEGDYTKIGRFGIGFVSVFAIDPDVVCVDTGRAGEWWRVVFRRDRSFERIRLSEPVEGTTVRLYRQASAQEVAAARDKARATLEYWCKHVRIELRLDGALMSGALDLEGLCKVEHRQEGTHLVMALVPEAAALRGYYHGGLTLHEEHDEALPHVAFKLDSRFLEHSLTRDNVIRDENYAKAMAIVEEVARTRLVSELRATLERGVLGLDAGARELLFRGAARHVNRGEEAWLRAALVPMLGGPPASLASLRGHKLWRATRMSPVVEKLLADRQRVVACAAGDAVEAFVVAGLGERLADSAGLCTAVAIPEEALAGWSALREALAQILKAGGWKMRVAVGSLDHVDSPVRGRSAISQAKFGELTPLADIDQMASGWLASERVLVLAAEHTVMQHLRVVAEREPELAAYLALKLFFLHGEVGAASDAALATAAAQARWRRRDGGVA